MIEAMPTLWGQGGWILGELNYWERQCCSWLIFELPPAVPVK